MQRVKESDDVVSNIPKGSIITLIREPIVPVLWILLASHNLGIWVQSYGLTSVVS